MQLQIQNCFDVCKTCFKLCLPGIRQNYQLIAFHFPSLDYTASSQGSFRQGVVFVFPKLVTRDQPIWTHRTNSFLLFGEVLRIREERHL